MGVPTYPMDQDEWRRFRTYKPDFQQLVEMTPDRFLQLTPRLLAPDRGSLRWLREAAASGQGWPPMYLYVSEDGPCPWTVTSHEGRHRAFVSREMGIPLVPVILIHQQWSPELNWYRQSPVTVEIPVDRIASERSIEGRRF